MKKNVASFYFSTEHENIELFEVRSKHSFKKKTLNNIIQNQNLLFARIKLLDALTKFHFFNYEKKYYAKNNKLINCLEISIRYKKKKGLIKKFNKIIKFFHDEEGVPFKISENIEISKIKDIHSYKDESLKFMQNFVLMDMPVVVDIGYSQTQIITSSLCNELKSREEENDFLFIDYVNYFSPRKDEQIHLDSYKNLLNALNCLRKEQEIVIPIKNKYRLKKEQIKLLEDKNKKKSKHIQQYQLLNKNPILRGVL